MIPFPFTVAETCLALSLVLPPAQAQRMAEDIVRPGPNSIGWGITEETLVLLSLASPELEAKVGAFLRSYSPSLDHARWLQLREQMQQAIASGQFRLIESGD